MANLGYRSTALGFIAGFTGREIERGVRSLGFDSDFIQVEKGMSRINVKLKSDQESEINGMGPEITACLLYTSPKTGQEKLLTGMPGNIPLSAVPSTRKTAGMGKR